jgi:hypothetical protein
MTPLGYRTAAEHRAQRSTGTGWSRAFAGCAIGCGALVVIAGIVIAFVAWWALTPGQQHRTVGVIDHGSALVAGFAAPEGSEQLNDLLSQTVRKAQEIDRRRSDLPEQLAWLEELQQLQDARVAGDVANLIPRDATVAIAPGPSGDEMVAAANFRRFVRPIRSMVMGLAGQTTGPDGPVIRSVDGHDMMTVDDGFSLSFVDGTLVMGSSSGAVERAVRSLSAAGQRRAPTSARVAAAVDELQPEWPLFAVADNTDGALRRLTEQWIMTRAQKAPEADVELAGQPPERAEMADLAGRLVDDIRFLTAGAKLASSTTIHTHLDIEALDAAAGARVQATLDRLLTIAAERLDTHGLTLDRSINQAQTSVQATIDISGLDRAIELWLGSLQESRPDQAPTPTGELPSQ